MDPACPARPRPLPRAGAPIGRDVQLRAVRLALAGDTMLGRGVAERILTEGPNSLFAPELVAAVREADLCVLNLECCISERGAPAPGKVFHFRAPAASSEALARLGVDCVTLANNHALDFGPNALLDTFAHLESAGIHWVGAGADLDEARTPAVLEAGGYRLGVIAAADHPADYAAAPGRPGVAFADLCRGSIPDWLPEAIRGLDADAILVSRIRPDAPNLGPVDRMSDKFLADLRSMDDTSTTPLARRPK